MADIVLSGGVENEVKQLYPEKWHRSKLIEDAYEAEDFFPNFGQGGRWVFFTAAPLRDDTGQLIGAIETLQDVTERKQMEAQLRIAAIVFDAQEGMVITDADGIILRVNASFSRITGYLAEDAVGKNMRLLRSGRQPPNFYKAIWASIAHGGSWQGEIWNQRKNGEVYPQWLGITAVKGDAGDITHYVGTFTDITFRKAAEDEIKHLAFYDALTDLPNRMLLNDRMQQALVTAKRENGRVALMFLDLDKFKPVNDTFGHEVGDKLLKEAARSILECSRESDTVARIGGDEFIVLLRSVVNAHDAFIVAEKIRAALSQPFNLDNHRITISSSIGIALFPDHGSDGVELSKNADIAMYQAKKTGRDTVEMFGADIQTDEFVEANTVGKSIANPIWETTYASGESTIDKEHRHLFSLVNILLEKATTQHAEPIQFNYAFDDFLAFVVEHFAHEESILLNCGYSKLAEHAEQHHAILDSALKLRCQSGESGVSVRELIEFLVSTVVTDHMLKIDQDFFWLFSGNHASSREHSNY